MTTSATGAVLAYTPERWATLRLANRGLITASPTGTVQRVDGRDLAPGVFAALLTLRTAGYLDHWPPERGATRSPLVRLTLAGTGLLSRFNLEHGQHTTGPDMPRQEPSTITATGGSP